MSAKLATTTAAAPTAAQAAGRLTDEQRSAIERREVSIALSAGAGCGKTHVLTERFLSHLDPARTGGRPARLAELVAITFTDRAAREMRDRIRKSCHQRLLAATDDEHANHWLKLIRELESARVSTIHSFCGSLLRSHAVEAGLDPHFFTLEQNHASTLLAEVLDDRLRRLLMDRLPAAMDLVVRFGLDGLRTRVQGLLAQAHQIDFAAWRARTPDEVVQIWAEYHRRVAMPTAMRLLGDSAPAGKLQRIVARHEPNHAVMQDRCRTLARLLPKLAKSDTPADDLLAIRECAMVQGGGAKKAWPSEEVYDEFKEAAEKLRKEIDKLKDKAAFDLAAARPAAELGLQLLEVAQPVLEAYTREKRELGCLDFDDLLVRARDLLTGDHRAALRKSLAGQIELLLVDEFQDTDPLQVELVRAMCDGQVAEGKLFFVGDYKQSIYRFRRADPQVFRALQEEVPKAGRLPLTRNFRSQPAILSFVNALFCDALADADGKYEPLVPHRVQVTPTPAVEFLWAPADLAAATKETVEELRSREADWIARRLREILDGQGPLVWDRAAEQAGRPAARPARPGDIAILFRALSNVALYEEALRRHDIPYYLVGGHAFYAQQEIFDLMNLLRAIDSECDEVSLVGVLRSPYFCLADETLFWLTHTETATGRGERLSAGLFARKPPPQIEAGQRRRVEFAAATLQHLRAKKDRVPIADLINEALSLTGYDATLAAEFLGERKLANLHKLIDQARTFDSSAIFTLSDFITQLSEFVVNQPKEALAATHPETTDVVKLMSIHMAKGLEFPLVVVPDLARKPNASTSMVAFQPELGPLVKPPDDGQSARGTCGLDLYNLMETAEDEAERLRLLYVATTRAADYLLLSSSIVDLDKPDGAWMKLLAERFDLGTGECGTSLCDVQHVAERRATLARVTKTAPPLPDETAAKQRRPSLEEVVDRTLHLAEAGEVRQPKFAGPVPADTAARRQFSFSRLHGSLHLPKSYSEAIEPERLPPFTVQVDALGLGTLVHAVLADLPFGQPLDVDAYVARHAARQMADAAVAAEARTLIARFVESPRARQLAKAQLRHAELEFLLAWPPEAQVDDPQSRYLQGFLDCLYQDAAGAWHLLDYKTNQVDAAGVEALSATYEMQMLVYALAVERILGQPPASIVLHFLRPSAEKTFTLDDAARRKLHATVNQSIAAFVATG